MPLSDYGRRLLFSVVMGSVVGYERRHSERSAGIRMMALVSLGSALFTLTSMFGEALNAVTKPAPSTKRSIYHISISRTATAAAAAITPAFVSGPMSWDASRVSAAIPSGGGLGFP